MPNQTMAQCTQLVAWNVSFNGGSSFGGTCGTATIGGNASALVE